MPSITTDQGLVHYEVAGRGRPVILLHGWLGSWGLWQETMGFLSQKYRTYAVDFWGFGESGKRRSSYTVPDYINLVDQFMERLGIEQAPLIGHSMGGTVSLSVAIQYPKRPSKVVIIGSPIVGSSLAPLLKLAGRRWVANLSFSLWGGFYFLMSLYAPLISRAPGFKEMFLADLSKTTLESFLVSIATLRQVDLRPQLDKIKIPTMGMFGDRDNIVHPRQWQPMQAGIPTARIERFKKAGHFIMLDEPQAFKEKILDFLQSEPNQT
ncbi:MAG TPA: alpha/beta hydrolase [Anaerolineaceae bacterium]|nr:alpha/beta hydrolase [Anaerolineaceae bacterium]HPN50341.1 alpha/beta hydrolase [Anaerolineaceae bacterium]